MFDIDKLFLSRFYYDVKNGKANTSFKEGSHEYYANRLLSDYIALLKDSKSENEQNVNRTAHSNHASIDGDTKLLKDIIKDIEEGQAEKALDPFTPYSLWANASTKTEFITGKFGIGPFALNNNSHILTMLYGVKFKQDGFLGQLGMYRLDQSSDRYGNSILSWISGLINAHVDVAKDPYIARLNVNSYTYNLVNLMIRTGFGKDTFYFTTQPIMVEMATAYNNAASQYGSESSRSKSRRQNEAVEEVVYNFVKSNFSLPSNVGTLKQANKVLDGYFEKVRGISVDDAIQILLSKNNDILHQISKKHIPMNGHARMYKVQDNVNLSAAEIQYLVYRAKDKFQPYEQQLSDLVKYSKIDTRKQGKNVTEQMAYREGVDRLFNLPGNDYGLFEDLSDYYNDSYIKDKTNNALDLFMDIMGSFTIESTNQFQVQVDRILNQIGEKNASADMRKAVSKQIMNYIRAGFFNTWAQNMNINIKGLVSGNNTISDRLEDIRIKIMTDLAYSDMRSVDGSIKNYLLASLVQGFQHHEELRYNAYNAGTQPGTYQDVKFIKTLNFMDSDHVNEDDMAEAWDELLNDTLHPEIRMFARDLIMYAYITSGGNSGNNLFKYIPNSWKLNSYDNDTTKDSYAQYMQDQLELYQNSTDELPINIEEIILNNWFDDKFIPTIKADGIFFRAKGYYTGRYYYEGRNAPKVSIPIMLIKENADIEQFSDEEYIKIKRNCSDPHSPRNYTIYKKLSYTTNGKLIYVMVDPKGNKFPHDTVYEMRRNDADIQESTAIAAISAQFTESMMIAKQAMGIQGNSVSDIMTAFLGKLSAANNVGTEMAMINAFTKDPVLAELMKDAAGIHLAEDALDAYPTTAFGVQIDRYLINHYKQWLEDHPNGIVAYRTNKNGFNTRERVQKGIIGNPFDWQKYGTKKSGIMFDTWLRTGDDYGESLATEDFRQAIIERILNSDTDTPILYYKDLGHMSHATIIGWHIHNKAELSKQYVAQNRQDAEETGARTYEPETMVKSNITQEGYQLDDAFIQKIKDHIANDDFSVKNYKFDRIRGSLIKMVDALFEYLKDNNVNVVFISAKPDNNAGGDSMISPSEDGYGWVIQIKRKPKDTYLDIIHELLHITTSPFDNPVVQNVGMTDEMIKAIEKLNVYYTAFTEKIKTVDGINEAYSNLWKFRNKEITREELNKLVPNDLLELIHVSEFTSMFVSSDVVQRTMNSILYGDKNLFDNVINWIKDFLKILFKGYSYVDTGNFLDDVTEFLTNYKSMYQTPRQIVEGIDFGINVIDKENYKTNVKLKNIIRSIFTGGKQLGLGLGLSDIEISKQTESRKDGKYIIVRAKDIANTEKLNSILDKELSDTKYDVSYIRRGSAFLISSSNYISALKQSEVSMNTYNEQSLAGIEQYNLTGENAFSELMRMQNDDKELYDKYWEEMRNKLGC